VSATQNEKSLPSGRFVSIRVLIPSLLAFGHARPTPAVGTAYVFRPSPALGHRLTPLLLWLIPGNSTVFCLSHQTNYEFSRCGAQGMVDKAGDGRVREGHPTADGSIAKTLVGRNQG
jgi:hypothetical protein